MTVSLATSHNQVQGNWVKIGIVGKANGLLGAFFISGREDPLDKSIATVRIGRKLDSSQEFKVTRSRMQGKRPVMQCLEVSNRDMAEQLRGQDVWCLRDQITIKNDEYLWDDLIGKTVVDSEGQVMGLVEQVVNHGATDIIELCSDNGSRLAIPFVDTYFLMDFTPESQILTRTVARDIFDESWESGDA